MNLDVKNVVKKLGKLEAKLKSKIESGTLINEVKRFANGQVKTLRQRVLTTKDGKKIVTLINEKDVKKVVSMINERKKQIEKIAADLPSEVKTVRAYIKTQRKELEKIGNQLLKQAREGKLNANSLRSAIQSTRAKVATSAKKTTSKKAAARKTSRKKK